MDIQRLLAETHSFLTSQLGNNSTALVLVSDIHYFYYELITLSNLEAVIENPDIDIFVIHGEGITEEHVSLLQQLFPKVKQLRGKDLPIINELQQFYRSQRWGTSLTLKYVPLLLSESYSTTICMDVDILLFKDFTAELAHLTQQHDLACRFGDSAYSAHRLMPTLASSSLILELAKESWRSPLAGVFCLSQRFTDNYPLLDIFNHIFTLSEELASHGFPPTEETTFGTFITIHNVNYTHLPIKYHYLISDFSSYSSQRPADNDICLLHFKCWNSAEYLSIFPQFLTYERILRQRLSQIPPNYQNCAAFSEAMAVLDKIETLNRKNSYASRVTALELLHLYQELTPSLVRLLSQSRFFEVNNTLSTDRIILWSKFNPRCFRCDICAYQFSRHPINTEANCVTKFNPTALYFVIRYAVLGSNSDNLDLRESEHVYLFEKMRDYFALSVFESKPYLLSLKIKTDTLEFPSVFRKLEWFIENHSEEFMKI